MTLDCDTSFLYVVTVKMHAIVCVTVKFSRGFLHEYNDGKMEEFKGCNRFPDFLCAFWTVLKKHTALLRVVRKYNVLRFV